MPLFLDSKSLKDSLPEIKQCQTFPSPNKVLMVTPEYFDVAYIINPHMADTSGNPQNVNKELALKQWASLKQAYEQCKLEIYTLMGIPGLLDMVFAANQSFPFISEEGQKSVLLSHMASKQRKDEVPHFKKWYEAQGYRVYEINHPLPFEGCGDALWHHPYPLIWGGYGFRTDKGVYEELSNRFGWHIALLELVRPEFYHLDTCMSILNAETVAICTDAFTEEGVTMIESCFDTIIPVSKQEATHAFSCNCHCPDGKHVILQQGATEFVKDLTSKGFLPIEIDVGEYQKSGGSVFCMKMMVY